MSSIYVPEVIVTVTITLIASVFLVRNVRALTPVRRDDDDHSHSATSEFVELWEKTGLVAAALLILAIFFTLIFGNGGPV